MTSRDDGWVMRERAGGREMAVPTELAGLLDGYHASMDEHVKNKALEEISTPEQAIAMLRMYADDLLKPDAGDEYHLERRHALRRIGR